MPNSITYSARFNPVMHETHKRVIELLEEHANQGHNFQEVVTDAILKLNGDEPDMFPRTGEWAERQISQHIDARMDKLQSLVLSTLREIAKNTQVARVAALGGDDDDSEEFDSEDAKYAVNFMNSFKQLATNKSKAAAIDARRRGKLSEEAHNVETEDDDSDI